MARVHSFFTCVIAATAIAAAAAQSTGPRSVWDGVYTAEQARRGEKLAVEHCVACHGERLTGGESAPALAGDVFNANWDGLMLADLFDRMRSSMPQDQPGSLSRQQNADMLAYMLSIGTFPAGDTALAPEAGILAHIRFESIRPQK